MLNFSRRPETARTRPSASVYSELAWVVGMLTIQREGVDIFTVIWPSHILLTETNGVFALRDAIEYFEISFRDALKVNALEGRGEVK
jgi:hypothetical protein